MSDLLQRLVSDLASDCTVALPASNGPGLVLSRFRGNALAPPVSLLLNESTLQEHLSVTARDAAEVFPEVAPELAAYRLLLVHIDEALATGGTDLAPARGTLRWRQPAATTAPVPLAEADLVWRSHPGLAPAEDPPRAQGSELM